jgi:hypothetical protein
MRVLFFAAGGSVSAPVRIVPLLEALCASGDLEYFACVDGSMAMTGPRGLPFDAVLAHRSMGTRQLGWLRRSGLPFVYDIDDLILRSQTDDRQRSQQQDAVRWCLTNALCVTSPSRRLLVMLERRLGQPLAARSVYLPNAGLGSRPAHAGDAKPSLLWVCSHGEGYDELNEISSGVDAAARAIGTDVTLVGRFPDAVRAAIPGHRHVPWLEPQQYRRFLAEGSFIAVAPLPVALAADEQEFVNCKSDIKAAEYVSLGISALYSPAPPYTESDLPCAMAPTNSARDWQNRMIELAKGYPEEGGKLARHPALAGRQRQVIARQLLEALSRACAATAKTFKFRSLPTPSLYYRLNQGIRSIRAFVTPRRT